MNVRDARGGAAIAARRLHDGLRAAGVNSSMRVGSTTSDDPSIGEVTYPTSIPARLQRHALRSKISRETKPYSRAIETGIGLYSTDIAPGGNVFWSDLPGDAVVNLHWVAGVVDMRPGTFPASRHHPLVWTLHDCNAFTGGCHYPMGCSRFEERCGSCPRLDSRQENDLSRRVHDRKRANYRSWDPRRTRIVASSEWLATLARASLLLADFEIVRIPLGINTAIFKPRDRAVAREVFGVPPDARVILFAAASLTDPVKGIDLLEAALSGLNGEDVVLVSVGASKVHLNLPFRQISLGEVLQERLLSLAYSTADVFVTSTRAEAFGLVVIEAMASGLPVIGFNVGGVGEAIRHEENGLLVAPGDVGQLRAAIERVLHDSTLRAQFARASRSIAVKSYELTHQVDAYVRLYQGLISEAGKLA